MISSLLSGLLLAIGHHFYYTSLHGTIVESQDQQEWFFRIGTGMAFLTRAFLSAAIGLACSQILWRTLRSNYITIQGINSLFESIHNAWELTNWELWSVAPALGLVATVAW